MAIGSEITEASAQVYHYTDLSSIIGIFEDRAGLVPLSPVNMSFTDLRYATFALPEARPSSWTENPWFPQTWKILVASLALYQKNLLLEIDVDGEAEGVFVADRAHKEFPLSPSDSQLAPTQYRHKDVIEGLQAFTKSIVPFWEHQAMSQTVGGHLLPEVIIIKPIPLEQVRVAPVQPLLEALLQDRDPYLVAYTKRRILDDFPRQELMPWRQTYEAQNGPIVV